MTQFKTEHGVIVDVDDKLAARIGGKWKPFEGAVEVPDGDPAASWKVPQLKAYAAEHAIDVGDAKSKPDILAALGVESE